MPVRALPHPSIIIGSISTIMKNSNFRLIQSSPSRDNMRLRTLAIELSKLEGLTAQKLEFEQYQTGGDLAARWLSDILAFDDISDDCRVADLGSGNGILGIGAVLLGAKSALLVEIDEESCSVCRRNIASLGLEEQVEVVQLEIGRDDLEIGDSDIIISNPPWGRQTRASDRPFMEEIISTGVKAHLMHSAEATHVEKFFIGSGWGTEKYGIADFALPSAYDHHTRERGRTKAVFWRMTPP